MKGTTKVGLTAVLSLLSCWSCVFAQTTKSKEVAQPAMRSACDVRTASINTLVKESLPRGARLENVMTVDLENDGHPEVAFIYSLPAKSEYDWQTVTARVFRCDESGWKVAYEDEDEKMGANDKLSMEKIGSKGGKVAIVLIRHYEGAGTATSWELLAMIKNRVTSLPSDRLVRDFLARRGYVFNGYNSVKVDLDLIVDEMPGYSPQTARCCPDKAPLRLTFRFTGSTIQIESVKTTGEAPESQ